MLPLNSLSILEFKGHDAGQFLHNQLSADILGINPGTAGFACCCNPAGRVLALFLVSPHEGSYFVVCASELADELSTWLGRFIFREKVSIEHRPDLQVFAGDTSGPAAPVAVLRSATGLNYALAGALDSPTEPENPAQGALKAKELRRGVCWLGKAGSGQYLPQMLGYEQIGALSFNKGCYPGQEIIARTRYLGKLKRRPVLVEVEHAETQPGDKVELLAGEHSFSAVIADQAPAEGNNMLLFLVARMGDGTRADRIRIAGRESEILAQGFLPGQGSATT